MTAAKRPSDLELRLLLEVTKLTAKQIGERCGVATSTAQGWITEYKARTGQHITQVRAKARTARTRPQLAALASDLLDIAVDIARDADHMLHSDPRTRVQKARLCIELHSAILGTMSLAPDDKRTIDRPDLLEQVKRATAGATARKSKPPS